MTKTKKISLQAVFGFLLALCFVAMLWVMPTAYAETATVELMPAAARTFSADAIADCGWKPWKGATDLISAVDKTVNHGTDGTGSYKMHNEARGNQNISINVDSFVIGETYTVSISIKTEGVFYAGGGTGAFADYGPVVDGTYSQDFFLGYRNSTSSATDFKELGDNDWQVFTASFVATSTTYSFRARLWGSYGTMWVDNYSVTYEKEEKEDVTMVELMPSAAKTVSVTDIGDCGWTTWKKSDVSVSGAGRLISAFSRTAGRPE